MPPPLNALEKLFEEARTRAPSERDEFLRLSSDDPDVRAELASLLRAADLAAVFFEELARATQEPGTRSNGAAAADPGGNELRVGRMVAQYQVRGKLGAGGNGIVYRARDVRLGRDVALKFLPHVVGADPAARARFMVEARAVAALDHANVCALYEIGEDADGRMFLAMAYCGERTLARMLEQGPLPVDEALEYARQIARALVAAHRRGVAHRDIKPGNLLVTEDGLLKVVDFGLAKLADVTVTGVGVRVGTVAYMSPEQTREGAVDHRTDLWSLGVVMYEMLTGVRPFRAVSDRALIDAIRSESPVPPSALRAEVPPEVQAIVLRLLSREPRDRDRALRALLGGSAPEARSRSAPWRRRATRVLAGSGLLALATAGSLFLHAAQGGARHAGSGVADTVRPEVLFVDLAAEPADSTLAQAASAALRIDLSRSPAFRLAPVSLVQAILSRAGRPRGGSLDLQLARDVAERGGISAIISGTIRRLGTGYVLTAQLRSAASSRVVKSSRTVATGDDDVVAAIGRLSHEMREGMGESLASLRSAVPLPSVTTTSLEALREYVAGFDGVSPAHITHLEHAVALDSGFAMAWRKLGAVLYNHGRARSRIVTAFTRAYENRHGLTERERLIVEASYYERVAADHARAIDAADRYIALYSSKDPKTKYPEGWFTGAALQWLAVSLRSLRDYDRAEAMLELHVRLQPLMLCGTRDLLATRTLADLGRVDDARRAADAMWRRCGLDDPTYRRGVERVVGVETATLGDFEVAEEHYGAALAPPLGHSSWRAESSEELARVLAAQGRLRAARALVRQASSDYEALALHGRRLAALAESAAREALVTRHSAAGLRAVGRALARTPLSRLPPLDRPYLPLATLYARAGRITAARAMVARFEQDIAPEYRGEFEGEYGRARGEVVLAEGHPDSAVAEFRRADIGECQVCALPGLARAYDAAGQRDSAIAVYRRYVETPSGSRTATDAANLGPALERLARLYDASREPAEAAHYYTRFVALWARADRELAPRVARARRRLAALPPPQMLAPTTGTARVTTVSTGASPDLSAYVIAVDDDVRSIGRDDTVTFRFLSVGEHRVRLGDVAGNCSAGGEAEQRIVVRGGDTANVSFHVACVALPPAEIDVSGTWTGTFEGTRIPGAQRFAGRITLRMEQHGDGVTLHSVVLDDPLQATGSWPHFPWTFAGVGRVSGRTVTLYHETMPLDVTWGPQRITTTLLVDGARAIGSDREQRGYWTATMTLRRTGD